MSGTTYTIDPDPDGGYWVHQHGTYGRSSVLAGQYRRCKCRHYDTVEEAQAEYPQATVSEDFPLPFDIIRPVVPASPPPDFDYLDAGEYWSEEDY